MELLYSPNSFHKFLSSRSDGHSLRSRTHVRSQQSFATSFSSSHMFLHHRPAMTALLSPAVPGSMQNQMEAKLASVNLKSPGVKFTIPGPPSARTFHRSANPNRQWLAFNLSSSFLSPDAIGNSSNAAATLPRQQHTKLKATGNAAHRIPAPALETLEHKRAHHLSRCWFTLARSRSATTPP